ncbi:MAG: hypothetical protein JWL82_29 [Parcubacteria group bacterium]|nr:hypothetical protein [Parcubacteria group bacterium]
MPKWDSLFGKNPKKTPESAKSTPKEEVRYEQHVAVRDFVADPELEKIIKDIRDEQVRAYVNTVDGDRSLVEQNIQKADSMLEAHKDELLTYLEPYRSYTEEYFAKKDTDREIDLRNHSLTHEENSRFLVMTSLLRP